MDFRIKEVLGRSSSPLARPLVPLVLALSAGIAAPAWGLSLPPAWLLAAVLAVLAALALSWGRGRPARLAPLALFWLLGVALYQQAAAPSLPPHHLVHLPQEQDLTLLGRLHRAGKKTGERSQLFLEVQACKLAEDWQPAGGRLVVTALLPELPPVGTAVVCQGRVRAPRDLKNPGSFQRFRHLAADGIFREMHLWDPQALVILAYPRTSPLGEKLRGGVRRLLAGLDPACRAIYQSMLLGDQGEVTREMRQTLARTGTSHLLVINGLHLSMVAAVVFFLASWVMRRSPWLLLRLNLVKAATLAAAASVVGYAWVAGGSPSTQRAEVMVLAYLLLVFLGRPRELWSALALAALAILAFSPLRLFSISFQLSFAAVVALILAGPRLAGGGPRAPGERPGGLGRRGLHLVREWLLVSLVATLATAPLVAAYFQVVSLFGFVVNAVAIPLVLGLALPLGEAAVLAQALGVTPLAKGLLAAGQVPLWLGYQAIAWAAHLPASAVTLPIPTGPQMAAYYVLLALLLVHPGRLVWAGRGAAALALAATVTLPLMHYPRHLEVTCLDTHGGLAGVVVAPGGQRLAFSAVAPSWPGKQGSAPGPLPAYLHWRQFRHLELAAALSLAQGNALELLELNRQFRLGQCWYGRRGPEGPAYWELWNFLGDRGRPPRSLERGHPPRALGPVALAFPTLGAEAPPALYLTFQSREVLILPPLSLGQGKGLTLPRVQSLALLVLPAEPAPGPDLEPLIRHLQAGKVILYGSPRHSVDRGRWGETPVYLTRDGAVSVYLDGAGAVVRQSSR